MSQTKFHSEISSEPKHLAGCREKMKHFLESNGAFPKETVDSILVALGEAVTNCIRHSYSNESGHKIEIEAEDLGDRIVFKVRDYGKKIDLSAVKKPKLPPEKGGGLGLYFMQTIMDEMKYNTDLREGNELLMIKYKKENDRREN